MGPGNGHPGGRHGRRWLAALLTALLLGALGGPASLAASTPDPVLLVHGWRGDPSTWSDMVGMFAAEGRTAVAIRLPGEDNIKNAAAIRDFVRAQGWTRVDIVGQSMGGLSARHFIKFLRPSGITVDTYVSLGTPQYGIWSACVLSASSGGQMCPTSRFLRDLNNGDDTPGTTSWSTIYSTTDGIVPTSASRLDGGACHIEVPGPGHNDMDNDPVIFGHVLNAVDRGACPGVFR
jgi:triacylglycerol lipase